MLPGLIPTEGGGRAQPRFPSPRVLFRAPPHRGKASEPCCPHPDAVAAQPPRRRARPRHRPGIQRRAHASGRAASLPGGAVAARQRAGGRSWRRPRAQPRGVYEEGAKAGTRRSGQSADDLLALVQRLRDQRPVNLRGAAMAARLANDARSPLHQVGDQDLGHEIRAARTTLEATRPTPEHLAAAAYKRTQPLDGLAPRGLTSGTARHRASATAAGAHTAEVLRAGLVIRFSLPNMHSAGS